MTIRKSTWEDLPTILNIYADARGFMRENGNPTQWKDWYPPTEFIERDIISGTGHVCIDDDGEIAAVFYYNEEIDPTYNIINGKWINDRPYGVVHRIASRVKGAGSFSVNWCYEQCGNLKIDTHEDNKPMRRVLEKLGFTYCGIIWVLDGTEERIAFQKAGVSSYIA